MSCICQSNEGGPYGTEVEASGHQSGNGYYDDAFGSQVRKLKDKL